MMAVHDQPTCDVARAADAAVVDVAAVAVSVSDDAAVVVSSSSQMHFSSFSSYHYQV